MTQPGYIKVVGKNDLRLQVVSKPDEIDKKTIGWVGHRGDHLTLFDTKRDGQMGAGKVDVDLFDYLLVILHFAYRLKFVAGVVHRARIVLSRHKTVAQCNFE